jgi:galactose mutarotase-like enzyme
MSLVTIRNSQLTVTISSKGAELQSVREADGTERLWQGDPAFWASRAPIMFPICGGLKEDAYYLDGVRYEMPKHGYARKVEWAVEAAEADSAVFLLTEQHPGFPFRYEFRAAYTLAGNSLEIRYTVKNLDEQAFWFSVGSHEAWATPGGLEQYTIRFAQPEWLEDYVLEGNLIGHTPKIMGENATELPLKTEYFAVDALVFPTLKSRTVRLTNSLNAKTVRVDFDGMDVRMLWTKPGADYICIEPWCNAPDFVDADMQIANKAGCIRLESGESASRMHRITFE